MSELVKEILIALGGGVTAAISILAVFKNIMIKLFDNSIETAFSKSVIKFTNKLDRSTKAYEILLKKEFDYYEKLDPYMAMFVPLIQDLNYYASKTSSPDFEHSRVQYRELMLKYLEAVPILKNDAIVFRPYIPLEIFDSVTLLVKNLQEEIDYLSFVGKVLFENSEGEIDCEKMQSIQKSILMSIALVETKIKLRLDELVNS